MKVYYFNKNKINLKVSSCGGNINVCVHIGNNNSGDNIIMIVVVIMIISIMVLFRTMVRTTVKHTKLCILKLKVRLTFFVLKYNVKIYEK